MERTGEDKTVQKSVVEAERKGAALEMSPGAVPHKPCQSLCSCQNSLRQVRRSLGPPLLSGQQGPAMKTWRRSQRSPIGPFPNLDPSAIAMLAAVGLFRYPRQMTARQTF